jgi:transmembrane sensor
LCFTVETLEMKDNNAPDPFRIAELIVKRNDQQITPAEENELSDWLLDDERNRELFATITDYASLEKYLAEVKRYDVAEALENVNIRIEESDSAVQEQPNRPNRMENTYRGLRKWLATAAILLFLTLFGYFLSKKQQGGNIGQTAKIALHDIAPGGNKAILTLANGNKIALGNSSRGIVADQSGIITKSSNGQIVYSSVNSRSAHSARGGKDAEIWNTLSTPAGGQYTLTLADGTTAILDAASSIRFPVDFRGNARNVMVTGQVYFKVRHDADKPFIVIARGQTIVDIGTEFNISAYNDEPAVKTTLLEGSVKLINPKGSAILKPGQQAIVFTDQNIKVTTIDTEEATAWKNGYFLFHNEPLQSVMRKVSRWYGVDIAYTPGEAIRETYWGSINRYSNVSKVLKMLEATGAVTFQIEGKKILVSKK